MSRVVLAVVAFGVSGVLAVAASAEAPRVPALVFSADRQPALSGEVYRLSLTGKRIDLSRSPFEDTAPRVSPDGRWVAFFSDRTGSAAVYVVRPDGSGLRRISSSLPGGVDGPALAWSPDSRRLAVTTSGATGGEFLLLGLDLRAKTLERDPSIGEPAWSPDGRVATALDGGSVDAYTPAGRQLWSASSPTNAAGWSRKGLFATGPVQGTINVYDSSGRRVFSVRGDDAAWSPDGTQLAVSRGQRLEVLKTSGRVTFVRTSKLFADAEGSINWATNGRVVAYARYGPVGVDLRTGRITGTATLPPLVLARSSDGRLTATTAQSGIGFAVEVRQTGAKARVVGHVPGCSDDGNRGAALTALQFTPDERSLVYQSVCYEPLANLWAIAPDGTGLRRLTPASAEQTQPAWSPDGSRLAYTWSAATGLSCKGCAQDLYVASANGSSPTALSSGDDGEFDSNPSWSPDGSRLLYEHSTTTTIDLYEIAATGGQPTDLHIDGVWPAWGPTRIAYVGAGAARPSIWTAAPDGTDRKRVGLGNASSLAWSKDGRLAWLVEPYNGGAPALRILSGSAIRRVKLPFTAARDLAWSPDGTRFAIVAKEKGTASFDVYTFAADGTDLRRLTHDLDVLDLDWRR